MFARSERKVRSDTVLSMTKRADYALLALSHLALVAEESPDRLINTKEIAEKYDIPVELLAKILQILAKSGMVGSHPGPTGGYRILRNARDISVGEVVGLIDGPISLLHCSVGQENSCQQYSRCTIRSPLATIETRVKNLLEEISVAEISRTLTPPREFEDFSERSFATAIPMA